MRIFGRALVALLPVALAPLAGPLACSVLVDTDGLAGTLTRDAAEDGPEPEDARVPEIDASDARDARCSPIVHVDAPFTTELGPWVGHSFPTNIGYPRVESFDGTASAVLFPIRTLANEITQARSALWFSSVVPLVALDVSLEIEVRCTDVSSCADGVTVLWLGTSNPNVLDGPAIGARPFADVPGAGVALDNYKNDGDPPPPAIEIIETGRPGAPEVDTLVVASQAATFTGAPHRLEIKLRGERVTVSYDGTTTFGGNVPTFSSGLFGVVAGTGGETDAVAIRKLSASFYDCTP